MVLVIDTQNTLKCTNCLQCILVVKGFLCFGRTEIQEKAAKFTIGACLVCCPIPGESDRVKAREGYRLGIENGGGYLFIALFAPGMISS